MAIDGSHYICDKHSHKKHYSDIMKNWICLLCDLENAQIFD